MDRPYPQPPLRALRCFPEHEDQAQQQHSGQVQQGRPVEEAPRCNLSESEHDSESECEPDRLPHHQIDIPAAGAVERHEPERGEHQHPQQQRQIQVQPLAQEGPGLHR